MKKIPQIAGFVDAPTAMTRLGVNRVQLAGLEGMGVLVAREGARGRGKAVYYTEASVVAAAATRTATVAATVAETEVVTATVVEPTVTLADQIAEVVSVADAPVYDATGDEFADRVVEDGMFDFA